MKRPASTFLAALPLLLVAGAAPAQPAWKCADGVYQQTPCPGGKVVEATDKRPAAIREQARRAAAREQEIAERKRAEKAAAAASAASAAAAPVAAAQKPATGK
jgi:uncharacterized protein (DUF2147 family)